MRRLSVLALTLCACSDASTTTQPSYGGGILTSIAQLECTEAYTCQASYPGDTWVEEFGNDSAQCVAVQVDSDEVAQIDADVEDGTIVYDDLAAQDCLDGITFPDCATYWEDGAGDYPSACDNVLTGTVQDGQICNLTFECANPLSVCGGTCMPTVTTRRAPAAFLRGSHAR